MFKKAVKLGLVAAGTPFVLAMGAVCLFDLWLSYRKDPHAMEEFLDGLLNS